MTPRFLDLSNKLEPLNEMFRDVIQATSEKKIRVFVVGALARDIVMHYGYGIKVKRATEDIDFGIQVASWNQYEELRDTLVSTGNFSFDPQQQQRLIYKRSIKVDLVPFGAMEENGEIHWPPGNSTVMSALGFDEAYQRSVMVRLAADIEIRVSSLSGLALMKLIAWRDRQAQKDAKDLGFIISKYLEAGNDERLYASSEHADLLQDDDFDYERAGARMLGRDVGGMLSERTAELVINILIDQTGERSQYPLAEIVRESFHGDFEKALSMLEALKQGIYDYQSPAK